MDEPIPAVPPVQPLRASEQSPDRVPVVKSPRSVRPANGPAHVNSADATPDLSHIAEALRPLAVLCSSLHFDPHNARTHPDANVEAVMKSMAVFGQDQPLVVQKQGMIVRKGNGRLQAALRLGWKWIAAFVVDEDDVRAAARAVADNRAAELAAWDEEKLAQILRAIREAEQIDLEGIGFSQADIDRLLPTEVAEDEIPLPPDQPTTCPGDLWRLGDHRVLCGDSRKADDVDRLLDGAAVHLVNTDPPYGVGCEPRSNNAIAAGLSSFSGTKHHQRFDLERHPEKAKPTTKKMRAKDRPLTNDFLNEQAFNELLQAWFSNLARVLQPGRGFYIWGGYSNLGNFPPVLKACGLYFSQALIWVKQHPVLTRKDFLGDFELAFYGWRQGAAHQFLGPSNVTDVWTVKKVNPQNMIHLTQKPVELALRALQYSSRPGENVLDLFGGSGSTLMAAEQVGRKAFLMEIDPAYTDVIVQRWENLTGRKAERQAAPRRPRRPRKVT